MKLFDKKMSISFKLNFHGKNQNCNYGKEMIVEEVLLSILKSIGLYPTVEPTVYSFTFGTRILNKSPHVKKMLKEVIRDNVTVKLISKKDMGYS